MAKCLCVCVCGKNIIESKAEIALELRRVFLKKWEFFVKKRHYWYIIKKIIKIMSEQYSLVNQIGNNFLIHVLSKQSLDVIPSLHGEYM